MRNSSAEIHELHPDAKNIATGVSLVVGLANDRQITFQSGFEGDESDTVVNARLDRLLRVADRLKARYELADLETKLSQHKSTVAQYEIDQAETEARFQHQQALRRVELDERIAQRSNERKKFEDEINTAVLNMQEARQGQFNAGAAEHTRAGRLSAYVPKGAVASNIAKIDKAIKDAGDNREKALADFDMAYDQSLAVAQGEIDKAEEERKQTMDRMAITVEKWSGMTADLEAQVAQCRELAGG